jgi:lysine 2,3-aminomutase
MAHKSLPRAAVSNKRNIHAAEQLLEEGLISPESLCDVKRVCEQFSLAITTEMAELIDPNDPNDPIAQQFVPQTLELLSKPEELRDPIGDDVHAPVKGIVHRYPDRVLLKPVHVCPIYCRFCFRREKVGSHGDGNLSRAELATALDYIRADANIWEVILTGGDPMIMSPRKIASIVHELDTIAHVKIIRFHTRVPIVDPARINEEMIKALTAKTAVYVVLHANHPRELTHAARAAIARIVSAGIPMVSQTVLLRGVNDDPHTLRDLLRSLLENRVKPYYLHHGDLAQGTSHFRTTVAEGQELLRALRGRVSGMCQPHYVLDIPGGWGKVPIGPTYLEYTGNRLTVFDYRGQPHPYKDV